MNPFLLLAALLYLTIIGIAFGFTWVALGILCLLTGVFITLCCQVVAKIKKNRVIW